MLARSCGLFFRGILDTTLPGHSSGQVCAVVQVRVFPVSASARLSTAVPRAGQLPASEAFSSCSGTSFVHLRSRVALTTPPAASFSVLIGPINHLKHLCSKERLPFSFVFLSSLALTLYFSLGVRPMSRPLLATALIGPHQKHSFIGSLLCSIVQVRVFSHVHGRVLRFESADYRSDCVRTRVLPRRLTDTAVWRIGGAAGRRQPPPGVVEVARA